MHYLQHFLIFTKDLNMYKQISLKRMICCSGVIVPHNSQYHLTHTQSQEGHIHNEQDLLGFILFSIHSQRKHMSVSNQV